MSRARDARINALQAEAAQMTEVPAIAEGGEVAALERPVPRFGVWTPVDVAMPARARPVLVMVRGRGWTKAHYNGGPQNLWHADSGIMYRNGVDIQSWMPGPPVGA